MKFKYITVRNFLHKGEYDQGDEAVIQYDDLYDYIEEIKNLRYIQQPNLSRKAHLVE